MSSLVAAAGLVAALVLNPDAPIVLSLDISDLARMPPPRLREMVSETTAIWRPYGVSLTWTLSPAVRPIASAGRTLTIARETRAADGASRSSRPRLGSMRFRGGEILAEETLVLSVDAIERLVDAAPWADRLVADCPLALQQALVGRALGRVLAHEIGHFLLAWRTHAPEGLMRSDFPVDVLVAPDRRPFRLSPALIPRLNARLAQLGSGRGTLAQSR